MLVSTREAPFVQRASFSLGGMLQRTMEVSVIDREKLVYFSR